jgi:hypothetical protein
MGSLWAATQWTPMPTTTATLKDTTIDDIALVLHVQRDTEAQRRGTALPTVTAETAGMGSEEIATVLRITAMVILHDTTVSDRNPPPTMVLLLIDALGMRNDDDRDPVVVADHRVLADPGTEPIVVVPAAIFMDDVDRGLARAPRI